MIRRFARLSLAIIGILLLGLPAVAPVLAQAQPAARPTDKAIIFVGGKKRTVSKRKIKRVSPVDQRGINPQPLPPKVR
ncbi:MAG: hypothetical protein ING31_07970 [Burkholderiales bacterium]|nr:hypothetical protein [Burkholderiales bacterium]